MTNVFFDMRVITIRLPDEYVEKIDALTRDRSAFIRELIAEKLGLSGSQATFDKFEELERRIARIEQILSGDASGIKNGKHTISLSRICVDEKDKRILENLAKGPMTTSELESKGIGLKRRRILDRIKLINKRAEEIYGMPILVFERKGNKQVWMVIENVSIRE